MREEYRIRNLTKRIYSILKYSISNIVIFEVLFALFYALFLYTYKGAIQAYMVVNGENILLNNAMHNLINLPLAIIMAGLLLLDFVLSCFQFSTLYIFLYYGYKKQHCPFTQGVKQGCKSLKILRHKGSVCLILYAVLMMAVSNFGVFFSLFPRITIPDFVVGEFFKYKGAEMAYIVFNYSMVVVFMFSMFIFPCMLLEQVYFKEAVKRNFEIVRKNLIGLIRAIGIIFICLNVPLRVLHELYGRKYIMGNILYGDVMNFVLMVIANVFFIIIFACYIPNAKIRHNIIQVQNKTNTEKVFLRFVLAIVAVLILIPIPIAFVDLGGKKVEAFSPSNFVIVGHRGCAGDVENTSSAVKTAQSQGAEIAEIDIFLSKDGIPMVMHDVNLIRLTGKPYFIYDLTAEELTEIEMEQDGYYSNIETLETLLNNVKDDSIKLMLELKLHGQESEGQNIIEEVVRLVKEKNMENRCIYQSIEYEIVEQMNLIYPDYEIGYCITYGVGEVDKEFLDSTQGDFLNFESTMQITEETVKACKDAGKDIYVWTVNDGYLIENLFKMGVDGVITDYPRECREILLNTYGSKI